MPFAVDQMKMARDQASQRLQIFVPIIFTAIDVGTTPRRLFDSRLGVSSLTLQAAMGNVGRITVGADASITPNYGITLPAGGSIHWEITLADILQTLGWSGLENLAGELGERSPAAYNRFRQTRLEIDASQFWVVADTADQDLTINFSTLPRY
jgi:hypothetical protein